MFFIVAEEIAQVDSFSPIKQQAISMIHIVASYDLTYQALYFAQSTIDNTKD